ncbi:MAG: glycosyltransferase family A protein [Parvularculaceae bacterium]
MSGPARPPKIVALLPAWNAAPFIDATLSCLARQTWLDFEVIVSVDQSTDETLARCLRFAENDARFRVIGQKERLGWVGNVNALLSVAQGDYLLIAYHDDLLDPSHMETLAALLDAHPDAAAAYSDVRAHYLHGETVDRVYREMDGVADPAARALNIIRRKGFWSVPNHGLFRASAVARAGAFRTHRGGEFSADWPWLLRLSLAGAFVRAPGFLCDKHYKAASLSHSWAWTLREFAGACEDCAQAVAASDLPFPEKLRLWGAIAIELGKAAWRRSPPLFKPRA